MTDHPPIHAEHPEAQASLDRVHVVLVAPSHPGNVGAAARAMRTMGLRHMTVVRGVDPTSVQAMTRASGAEDVLDQARRFDRLEDAIASHQIVVGTTARSRYLAAEAVNAAGLAAQVATLPLDTSVAILFGPERAGLSNQDLSRCHQLVYIPTAPDFRSLNLGSAVQVLCYALRAAHGPATPRHDLRSLPPATTEEMDQFHAHLETTLDRIGYLPAGPKRHRLLDRMRRMFLRMRPDTEEVRLLRGIFSRTHHAIDHAGAKGDDSTPETEADA